MLMLRKILPFPTALLAVLLVVVACREEATRPPIPTISAQTAGTVYCAQWSCAYNDCYMRPDWDGGSCCLEKTLNEEEAVPRPGYCSQPKPIKIGDGSCNGSYQLDGGDSWSSFTDDVWYCSVAYSCCAGGSGDKTQIWNMPGHPNPDTNPNCNSQTTTYCGTPPSYGGTSSEYPQPSKTVQ